MKARILIVLICLVCFHFKGICQQQANDCNEQFTHKSTDGAMWVLEGAVEGKYQVTLRPGDIYPKYTNCLMHLVNLTDLNIPKNRIY